MSLTEQVFETEVKASVQHCFATITDFDSYPEWFSTIQNINVLDRYRNGLAKRVEYRIDMKLKSVRYVLAYEYEKPTRLTWKAVDGDLEAIEGAYDFEKLGARLTRARCRQAVSLGFWVPGPIRGLLEQQALKQAVLEFKAAAEKTAEQLPRRRKK